MKYFLDTEFLEGTQDQRFLRFKLEKVLKFITGILLTPLVFYGAQISYLLLIPISIMYAVACYFIDKFKFKTKNTIDLISIGIVSEGGREFYEISKDFNLKEAWNRFQWKHKRISDTGTVRVKEYWIRENVLKPIFFELLSKDSSLFKHKVGNYNNFSKDSWSNDYNYFKKLVNKYGKSNKDIAERIKKFTFAEYWFTDKDKIDGNYPSKSPIEFYAYYGAYDWVVFCWIFGKMIDLPKGFPMFSKDLKVMIDDKAKNYNDRFINGSKAFKTKLSYIKNKSSYPTQDNSHNALDDAKWNFRLYKFLENLQ